MATVDNESTNGRSILQATSNRESERVIPFRMVVGGGGGGYVLFSETEEEGTLFNSFLNPQIFPRSFCSFLKIVDVLSVLLSLTLSLLPATLGAASVCL